MKKYEEICNGIIRPYREEYEINALGPKSFQLKDKSFDREDFPLMNQKGLVLQCSFYHQETLALLPCVIYLHTHTGSRLEALPILPVLLPSNINVFTLDLSGSGLSEGEFISLGWHEREDITCIVEWLRRTHKAQCIGLWGRGMGAVTALLYADKDPCIGGMVLDSPFVSLKQLAEEEIDKRSNIAGFIKTAALAFVRKNILKTAKFDVNDLSTLEHVVNTYVPAIFCCGRNDDFIGTHHSEELFEAYPGDKKFSVVDGGHNTSRPQYFLDSVAIFFYNTLLCKDVLIPTSIMDLPEVKSDDSYELL